MSQRPDTITFIQHFEKDLFAAFVSVDEVLIRQLIDAHRHVRAIDSTLGSFRPCLLEIRQGLGTTAFFEVPRERRAEERGLVAATREKDWSLVEGELFDEETGTWMMEATSPALTLTRDGVRWTDMVDQYEKDDRWTDRLPMGTLSRGLLAMVPDEAVRDAFLETMELDPMVALDALENGVTLDVGGQGVRQIRSFLQPEDLRPLLRGVWT